MNQAGSGTCLSKKKLMRHLLEGTAASNMESFDEDDKDDDTFVPNHSAGSIYALSSLMCLIL